MPAERQYLSHRGTRPDRYPRGQVDTALTFVLSTRQEQGQTKLEFITEDYHYPGAYDLHGKVILEKGAPVLNDLHRTDEQTERACT